MARWFEVDIMTGKVTCIDLMRANLFDVVIASERFFQMVPASSVEPRGQRRWPETSCACWSSSRHDCGFVKRKLALFRLHATMRYPIEETVSNGAVGIARVSRLKRCRRQEPAPAPEPPRPPTRPLGDHDQDTESYASATRENLQDTELGKGPRRDD